LTEQVQTASATDLSGPMLRVAATLAGVDVGRPLVWLRWVAVVASLVTVLVVHHGLSITLPVQQLYIVIAAFTAWSLAIHLWQRRAGPPGALALSALLKGDVLALTAMLYFTGGWTNPVVSLYLVPVAVSAAVLPARNALAVALTCGGCLQLPHHLVRAPAVGARAIRWRLQPAHPRHVGELPGREPAGRGVRRRTLAQRVREFRTRR
jgi:hypothetical protein